jgi:uncharacterized metal-binding protein YceD (DUF177 family)
MTDQPEFSRLVRLDTLNAAPRAMTVEADPAECAALARRFALPAIHRLSAEAALSRDGETVTARGVLNALVTQSCVATGEDVEAKVEEPFAISFQPPPDPDPAEEEIELGEAELDVIFYQGEAVDIGEAVAETLSLSLDPYPRAPGAETLLKEAGVKSEEEAAPLGALAAALLGKLKP